MFRSASAQVAAVRLWEKQIQVSRNGRMHRNAPPAWKNALAGIIIRDGSNSRDSEPFNQPFICGKEESLVANDRTTECGAELISFESGYRLIGWIEEILRIKSGVTQEFEG